MPLFNLVSYCAVRLKLNQEKIRLALSDISYFKSSVNIKGPWFLFKLEWTFKLLFQRVPVGLPLGLPGGSNKLNKY